LALAGVWGLSSGTRRSPLAASVAKTGVWRFRGLRLELARWLHVGIVQHSRAQNGSQPEVEVARSWNAMRQAAGRRPGEQPEREQRRDSDESEKSDSNCTHHEIALRRGIEIRQALTESAAVAAQPTPPVLSAVQPGPAQPAPEERIFFLPGLSFLWETPGA
jgi:hypothetical protein